jgi:predicted CXXCH cytochrome family protein
MHRGRSAAVAGAAVAFLAASCYSLVTSAERVNAVSPHVVSPPNQAVLLSGSIDVICETDQAEFEIDAKPHEWEAFEGPVRAARVRLMPGLHELRIGQQLVEVVVALNEDEHDGPSDWKIYRTHEMDSDPTRCEDCHEAEEHDGRIEVGELKSFEACLECHTPIEFEEVHAHILEPLEACQMCHVLHGSPIKKLLKAPMRKLCEECHDPDY